MKEHAGRCLQGVHRVTEVLAAEFDDLTPADRVFILTQVIWEYGKAFHDEVEKRRG